MKEPRYM